MTRLATTMERATRTAPPECFSGGYGRGPILPMQIERPSLFTRLVRIAAAIVPHALRSAGRGAGE